MCIRMVLVDVHNILRQGVKQMFDTQNEFAVVGEANNGVSAVKLVKELAPDIVLMDIALPKLNGIDATRQILDRTNGTKVIGLSHHTSRHIIFEMLKAGASAYLHKDCTFDEILRAIDAVMNGRSYLSPEIAGKVMEGYAGRFSTDGHSGAGELTERERQVLQLVAEGQTAKQAAIQLHLSVKTVEAYRRQIMDKLDIHSVAELTKFAIAEGLTFLGNFSPTD